MFWWWLFIADKLIISTANNKATVTVGATTDFLAQILLSLNWLCSWSIQFYKSRLWSRRAEKIWIFFSRHCEDMNCMHQNIQTVDVKLELLLNFLQVYHNISIMCFIFKLLLDTFQLAKFTPWLPDQNLETVTQSISNLEAHQLEINKNIWFICTLWLLLEHRGIKKKMKPTNQKNHPTTVNNHRHSVDAHLNLYFSSPGWLLTLMSAMRVKPSKERPTLLLSYGLLPNLDCPSSLQTKHCYISSWDTAQDTSLQDVWDTSLSLIHLTLADFRAHQEFSFFRSAMVVLDENIQMIPT